MKDVSGCTAPIVTGSISAPSLCCSCGARVQAQSLMSVRMSLISLKMSFDVCKDVFLFFLMSVRMFFDVREDVFDVCEDVFGVCEGVF